ncbi:hypothetical protein CN326_23870 [Bacillus sp. AFS018417]|nr:hypothetical protein CN326_23870 [Bacillus sp. AFS018417]
MVVSLILVVFLFMLYKLVDKKTGSDANLECCQNIHKNMRLITNIQSVQSIKIRIFILIPEQLIHIKI